MRTSYLLERAWVDGAVRADVRVAVEDGRFVEVSPADRGFRVLMGVATADKTRTTRLTGDSATRVPGLTLPGLANTHSHAFHRALRGRTQAERGTFWTWRERMYDAAGRLDPDSCFVLARAAYREMAAAGITTVGEFHYLHHQSDGTPYADPNAMGVALVAAAREAGIRITLLDTLYLSSGFGSPPQGVQRRYDDGSAAAWLDRVAGLETGDGVVVGHALHSVRAVPREALVEVGRTISHSTPGNPPLDGRQPPTRHLDGGVVHVHVSEQVAENEQCLAAYGCTPTQLLHDTGILGPMTTAVHATHLTETDVGLLGETRTWAGFCPTTERDLGDGIGPSRRLHEAGSRLTLGSDSHAVIDPFEEMRAVEMDERLATQRRGHWSAAELLEAATTNGHTSLGFPDAGAIAVGSRADLVTLDTTSPRTAGTGGDEHTAVFAATAADVRQVMVDGRIVFRQGDTEEIGRELDAAIHTVWEER